MAAHLEAIGASSPRLHASLVGLDPAQLAAALSDERSLLVRAPVGSGKTRVLVHRVMVLHRSRAIPLDATAVLTFTNRAAGEIRRRLLALQEDGDAPLGPDDLWLTGTFHGIARTLLARVLPVHRIGYRSDFTVLDDEESADRCDRLITRHGLRIRQRRRLMRRLRALAIGHAPPLARDDIDRLAALYTEDKRASNAMDFDDLVDHATALLGLVQLEAKSGALGAAAAFGARCVVVDEMQDCELRELLFLRRLGAPDAIFFGVGDPHQAIYGWRGSAPHVFSQVESDLKCRSLALPVSYRSTRTILDGARAVLGLQLEPGGELASVRDFGARLALRCHHDPLSEAIYLAGRIAALHAEGVPYAEVAILFRLRAQAEPLRDALATHGVPFVEDAAQDAAKADRGEDAATNVYDEGAARDADGEDAAKAAHDAVRLLTLHACKGLEFRHVFLAGVNDGIVPLGRRRSPEEDAEERRLLFVGMTRARDELELGYLSCPHQPGAVGDPSPYLTWLPASLVDWQSPSTVAPIMSARAPTESAPIASPSAVDVAPFLAGQAVRHPRYGPGVVVRVEGGSVECDFGKRGARSFSLALCPLTPA